MMRTRFAARTLFVAGFLLSAVIVLAQVGTATLTGRVTDSTGNALVGAKVQIINTARNVISQGQTNETGDYNVPSLTPGDYKIVVNKEGFAKEIRSGVTLHVADVLSIDFALQVGSVGQTVTVTSAEPLVDTSSSSLGGLIDSKQITDLPLNERNYIGLTLMQPGVTLDANEQANGIYAGNWYSSDGAPIRSNNFLMDGDILEDQNAGSTADFGGRTLGLDGIAEYRVLTGSIPAEYGIRMGSQTVMVSKGGSNEFHGDAFDYLRNSALDAANYFDVPVAANGFRRLPEYQNNNFGAAFGGPIRKDKTFFFANYEGVQMHEGVTNIENVPNANCVGPAGSVVWNGTLLTGQTTQPAGTIGPCTQLGANPSGAGTNTVTISPVTAPLLALYPAPNLPNNQETVPYSQPDSDNYAQIRVDQIFSQKDSAFARYTIDNDVTVLSEPYSQFFTNPKYTRHQYLTLSENHIFAPWLLDTARLSYARTYSDRYGTNPLTGSQYEFVSKPVFPGVGQLSVGGLTLFGPSASPESLDVQSIYTLSDQFTATHGKHAITFGADANLYNIFGVNPTDAQGEIVFSNLANFMAAKPTEYEGSSPGSSFGRTYQFFPLSFYGQDDWRVLRNLTLNLGIRYDPAPDYYHELHGESATLGSNRLTQATPIVGPLWNGNPTMHTYSPRVGLAWDVFGNGKTAVHSGAAMLYDEANLVDVFNVIKSQPPFSTTATVAATPTHPVVLTGFPLALPTVTSGVDYWMFDYHLGQPRLYVYNLTVQQQFPFSTMLNVSYAGSRGNHLIGNLEGNPDLAQSDPGAPGGISWPTTEVRENPNWASINLITAGKDSYYNALEVNVIKRMSHGLQFQSSYTWAHSIDDAQGGRNDCTASSATNSDPYDYRFDRGSSCFNAKQTWVFNYIYNLPSPNTSSRFLGSLVDGWGTMGIYTFHTGFPFNVWETTNRSLSGVFDGAATPPADRPDWNPAFTGHVVQGSPTQYYNPGAFTLQPVGTLGNVGRDSLTGPQYSELDFAMQKDFMMTRFGEGAGIQFRAELFNMLNHPNFSEPSEAVFAGALTDTTETPLSTAGEITSTLGTSRQIEMSLRLHW